jgi:hypothetical protein
MSVANDESHRRRVIIVLASPKVVENNTAIAGLVSLWRPSWLVSDVKLVQSPIIIGLLTGSLVLHDVALDCLDGGTNMRGMFASTLASTTSKHLHKRAHESLGFACFFDADLVQ